MTVNSFFDRRRFLCGGGVTLGLPLLDALKPKRAHAAGPGYAVFLVAMNGVQQAYMNEPERFWPSNTGTLTTASMMADASRAISELAPHASYLNVVKGINFAFRGNGCGHTGGGNQVLTAAQVSSDADFSKNKSLAMGPSVDYRIAKDLSDKEPLALYAGSKNGYIHDHVSHRGAKDLIVAESNPWISYSKLMGVNTGGGDTAVKNLVLTRRKSVNDLIRAECKKLLSDKSLSTQDRQRMDRHLSSVRDIEQQLIATVTPATSADFKSIDGQHRVDDNRPKVLNLQFDLIALALASGQHRVAFVQQGDGSDGINHVLDGDKLPNYHHISHRIDSDGSSGNPIAGAEMMHHRIDRLHMQTFRTLLDKLKAVSTPNGSLLDLGYAVWTNQQANGAHKYINVPYLIAGKAGGYLKTGQFVDIAPTMNNKLLNTLINAAGVRNASGGPVDDFGDGSLPKGLVTQIVA